MTDIATLVEVGGIDSSPLPQQLSAPPCALPRRGGAHRGPRRPGPRVDVLSGAEQVQASDWDEFVDPSGFYSSHAWLRSLELAHGSTPVLAASDGDRLRGVLPLWENTDPRGLFSLGEMTQGLLRAECQEVLWLGTRRGTANTITCVRDPVPRSSALSDLVETARHLAAARGMAGTVWPYLSGADAREAASSHPLAQVVLQCADATVTVPRDGMQGMETRARSRDRKEWQREQRVFCETGGSVRWTTLTADVAVRIAPLLAATRDKYGAAGGVLSTRRTLAAQISSGVAQQAAVALAESETGSISAAAVFYAHRDWLFGRYWGASPTAPRYAYYMMTCYNALDWAARHGFRHLHLSVPASPAKLARGAEATPLALVYIPADPTTSISAQDLHQHNAHVARQWTDHSSSSTTHPDPAWSSWAAENRN